MNEPIEVIQAIADRLHGEGVFHRVDSVDESSGTLIVFCTDGNPYEVRVRRMTEADVDIDIDGVLPGPITPVVQHNTDSQPAVAVTSSERVHVFGWVSYLLGPDADQYVRDNA